jgi:hypothetical protein
MPLHTKMKKKTQKDGNTEFVQGSRKLEEWVRKNS